MTSTSRPSRKQIRKAAALLRHWWLDPTASVAGEIGAAWGIVSDFRSTFQRPLDKVTTQLRRFVEYESPEQVIAAQRLKRMPTIMNKLGRQPNMDITRMQDIGGCRAVLPSIDHVGKVFDRIVRHWELQSIYNYVAEPKPSGYRAVHVVVIRDERLIEIQLRTDLQHDWAVAVETFGARIGRSIKDGEGPDFVLRYFELAGRGIELVETGQNADDSLVEEFAALGEQVRGLLDRND